MADAGYGLEPQQARLIGLRSAIRLSGAFAQVAGFADRLAVKRVEPQWIVQATKALEVVHLGGGRDATPLPAWLAMGMELQVREAQAPPSSVIAASGRALAVSAAEA